jgi:phosphatidylserine synthase
LLAFRKYFIIIPGMLLTILTMLFLFDLFSPPVNWFYGIGLPVTIALFVAISIITILWKVAHFRGFNILAIAFLVLSGFCIVSEVFIDKYLSNKVDIRWSAIVAVSILPIALILLFMHYRMKKGKRLDSYFHV